MDLYPKVQTNRLFNFNMLYDVNVILNKFSYRKCLSFGVYKYLIYRFHIAAQFVFWYFAELQKYSFGFVVICIETHGSVTHKENVLFKFMKTFMES